MGSTVLLARVDMRLAVVGIGEVMHFGVGEILPTPGNVVGEDVPDHEMVADLLGEEVGIAGVAAVRSLGRQGLEAFGDFEVEVLGDERTDSALRVSISWMVIS